MLSNIGSIATNGTEWARYLANRADGDKNGIVTRDELRRQRAGRRRRLDRRHAVRYARFLRRRRDECLGPRFGIRTTRDAIAGGADPASGQRHRRRARHARAARSGRAVCADRHRWRRLGHPRGIHRRTARRHDRGTGVIDVRPHRGRRHRQPDRGRVHFGHDAAAPAASGWHGWGADGSLGTVRHAGHRRGRRPDARGIRRRTPPTA